MEETTRRRRVLIALHGHEPPDWAREVARAVPVTGADLVRLLVVHDLPAPPFTSLLPAARGRYEAALACCRQQVEHRARIAVERLRATLPAPPEVTHVPSPRADPGRVIAEHARSWTPDLLVVGRDARGGLARLLLRSVHDRVLDRAPCAVLVTPAGPPARSDDASPTPRRVEFSEPAATPGGA
jgi:nucleotide-binding universal stress UspA family protein